MARSKQTLFDQLKDERSAPQRPTLNSSPVLRVAIIIMAIVGTAAFFPGVSSDDKQEAGIGLIGTIWTEESVVAEHAFPVERPAVAVDDDRLRAMEMAPFVFRADTLALESWLQRLAATDMSVVPPAARRGAEQALRNEARYGITNIESQKITSPMVAVVRVPGTEHLVPASSVHDLKQSIGAISALVPEDTPNRADAIAMIATCVSPSLRFDSAATTRTRDEAAQSVATTAEIVKAGEIIIRKGDRVDSRALLRLNSYRDAQYLRNSVRISWFVLAGSLGHASTIIGLLVLFVALLRRSSFERNAQFFSLLILPVLASGMSWLSVVIQTAIPLEYAVLIPALSMIVSVLFDARTAFVCAVTMSLAAAGARGNDYAIALEMLTASTLAAYTANRIQSRTQIFTSIITVFIGLGVTTLAINLERSLPLSLVWPPLLVSAVNAVATPLVTLGVIILVERLFNVATDMRLDEFDNINHPLLVELNERAPGTYQHTLAVARLAETAAAAIGANALLAKVGVLFHDIGKMEKSEYFVENQMDIGNKHDRLTPKKSAAIIRQHVQDGIELAKEYKLPERIWQFIPMHHGTMLIRHFYAMAVQENQNTFVGIDQHDFRYPGPKPTTKETAIAMLADAAEALSRVVNTGQRVDLEAAIDRIIVDRFEDGQLSESPLTTQDLDIIREAFVKNLLASSHGRVRYKGMNTGASDTPAGTANEASTTAG